ncbi:iron uptake porin [Lusitaniella coriacea LEGE 07157]|uniref:Iron uptake porin n=1 Tax=Lusitaniella coriacea LEGE 07157 TaxID=945747 RepID=A0A8J7DW55_9CYAN|nr:iron uptake porin [Lusitaniella coriacea]MBE9116142.1 iron uptake porin [Lusitaniella coriacea LEGE 07157]
MPKSPWQKQMLSPVLLSSSLLLASSGIAQASEIVSSNNELLETIQNYSDEEVNGTLGQGVEGAAKFRDVSPSDWAYQALNDLIIRYDCLVGYPDGTFRGNRALSRYEFAAGLNACLNQIERLIAAATADFVTREDLETLRRLMQEFETELASLGTRVDNLEARTAFLEDHQFSTTTRLNGEVLFTVAGIAGDEKVRRRNPRTGAVEAAQGDLDDTVIFGSRVRLNLDTSFTGKDRLRVRLQARNLESFANATRTDMSRLGHDGGPGNNLEVNDLYYRFPVGENLRFFVGTSGLDFDEIADPTNPFFDSGGSGALSRFGRKNPFIFRPTEGTGAGTNIKFNDLISVDLAYLTDDAAIASAGEGLFNGSYTAGVQLNFSEIAEVLDLSFSYLHSYQSSSDVNLTGSTGSRLARRPFLDVNDDPLPTSSERFGVQASWRVTPNINIAGWGGYMAANAEIGGGDADLWTWAANVAFLDLLKEGSVLGLIVGMPPKATSVSNGFSDPSTSILIEAQYRYPVSDNITITPGFMAIFNPEHNSINDTIYIGAIRTRFKF